MLITHTTTIDRQAAYLANCALTPQVVNILLSNIIVVGETGGSGNAVDVIVRGGREGRGGVGLSLTKLLAEGEGEGGRGGMKCK